MGLCPKENAFAPLIYINGQAFKFQDPYGNYLKEDYYGELMNTVNNPAIGYNEQSEQLVKSTRNAEGKVVAQTVNRRLNKFDNLYWPYLSRTDVVWLKKQIAKFECKLGYYDEEADQFVERKYYWGDFSATPCEWETVWHETRQIYYKRPIWYKDVKCNLVDMRLLMKRR